MRIGVVRVVLLGISLLLTLPAISASARPRDEVMSRAFRCAPISDARLWLDCYYGAAQPARAALGLPLAPAEQAQLSVSPITATAPPRDVAMRDKVLSGAFSCSELNDDRQWLDCYYAAALPMRSDLGLKPTLQTANPAILPSNPTPTTGNGRPHATSGLHEAAEQDFGLADDPKRVDSISGRMASYNFDKEGIFTVNLSNGQVWRQISGDTTYAHWKDAPGRYLVRVSRGFLGSYSLQMRNAPGLYKVQRLK